MEDIKQLVGESKERQKKVTKLFEDIKEMQESEGFLCDSWLLCCAFNHLFNNLTESEKTTLKRLIKKIERR